MVLRLFPDLILNIAMGIEHLPRNRNGFRRGDNLVSARHPADEFFDLLSPLLEEAATFEDHQLPRQERLLKENARLRALAVELSNLLGDLPVRDWAARCDRRSSP
jgi:hypothetical protein